MVKEETASAHGLELALGEGPGRNSNYVQCCTTSCIIWWEGLTAGS